MHRREFKEAFKRGLGNALLFLKDSDSRDEYKEIVLWCCLHNTCYDAQCEGGRGDYLFNAICLFDDRSCFESAIIAKFHAIKADTWLFEQLCELLFLFAEEGSQYSRNALYEKYDRLQSSILTGKTQSFKKEQFEWLCVWLTSLDGFRGFKRISENIGAILLHEKHVTPLDFDWFLANSKNKFGAKHVENYLQKQALKNDAAKALLKELASSNQASFKVADPPTLNELIEECNSGNGYRGRGLSLRFAKFASDEDLLKLAQVALQETNAQRRVALLWAFRKRRFPLEEQFVYDLAEDSNPSIRGIAFEMMAHLSAARGRNFAIDLIQQNKELENALGLLCCFYQKEDKAILLDGLKRIPVSYSRGGWHSVFMDTMRLFERSSRKIDPDILIYMYRKTLCSSCRSRIVEQMIKRKVIPFQILGECLWDSYEDTRIRAGRRLRKWNAKQRQSGICP